MSEPVYDLEAEYDAEIAPLMEKVIEVCKRLKMPMVASFAYRSTGDGIDLCTTTLGRDGWKPPEIMAAVDDVMAPRAQFAAFTITKGSPA